MKRLLILGDANSAHIHKWALSLSLKGIEVGVFTLTEPPANWPENHFHIQIFSSLNIATDQIKSNAFLKVNYLKSLRLLKKVIKQFKPDIVHAHYATSYGLLARLSRFRPYIISAWGSDVMDFPGKSIIHKSILKRNLKSAAVVMATSETISAAIKNVIDSEVEIVPFGIDLNVFKRKEITRIFDASYIVIGTIKSLEKIYGIDILINAFHILKTKYKSIKLLIVGTGSQELAYKSLVKQLNLDNDVVFTGKIDYEKITDYHNMIDIFVNVSRNESFGVSVIEASACEKPVIVSNVGGLPNVVVNSKTGFIVNTEDPSDTARAIDLLMNDSSLRFKMGEEGRQFVKNKFELNKNTDDLIGIYERILKLQH